MSKIYNRCKKHLVYLENAACSVYLKGGDVELESKYFLITNVSAQLSENFTVTKTIGNKDLIHTFDTSIEQSGVQITFMMFGDDGKIKTFIDAYNKSRLSEKKGTVVLFIHGASFKCVIVGMDLQMESSENDVYQGTIKGLIVEQNS